MKKQFILFCLYFVGLIVLNIFIPAIAAAQEAVRDTLPVLPPLTPDSGIPDFVNLYNLLYVAVVNVLSYLHNFLPFKLVGLNSKWVRVVAIGLVVGVIFYLLGLTKGITTVFLFLQAVGFYEIILKKAYKSPPVAGLPPAKKAA
jgi:hypothetical protein